MVGAAFLASSLVVVMAPGPDLVLITGLVLRSRRRGPALAAAAGMITAGALQAALGFAGLAVLLRTNPALFAALRWLGAAVLFRWGLLAVRSALRPRVAAALPPVPAGRAYLRGFASTASNPKVGVFLMAFLPQFVPAGQPASAFALLAAVYLGIVLLWLVTWTNLVHRLAPLLARPAVARGADALIGAVFLIFGLRLLAG
jgi:threonine/homoserine/homoserine lactone efflux protein